jgi:excisionase family DNA binding protein
VEEAARLLSLNRSKIYTLCMRGELRSFKAGRSRRIPVAALHDYLRERTAG